MKMGREGDKNIDCSIRLWGRKKSLVCIVNSLNSLDYIPYSALNYTSSQAEIPSQLGS